MRFDLEGKSVGDYAMRISETELDRETKQALVNGYHNFTMWNAQNTDTPYDRPFVSTLWRAWAAMIALDMRAKGPEPCDDKGALIVLNFYLTKAHWPALEDNDS